MGIDREHPATGRSRYLDHTPRIYLDRRDALGVALRAGDDPNVVALPTTALEDNVKTRLLLIAAAWLVLSSAVAAQAAKRLTTGSSGLSSRIECHVINVSETKIVVVNAKVRNSIGTVVNGGSDVTLSPLRRTIAGLSGSDLWCDVLIVSGSTKDVRANMVIHDGTSNDVVGTEAAREK